MKKMNTTSKFLLGLLLLTFSALAVLIPLHNKQHHKRDCSGGTVFVLSEQERERLRMAAYFCKEEFGDSLAFSVLNQVAENGKVK